MRIVENIPYEDNKRLITVDGEVFCTYDHYPTASIVAEYLRNLPNEMSIEEILR